MSTIAAFKIPKVSNEPNVSAAFPERCVGVGS
jgi:hypothetical protein